jgi:CubicO group peptidase (beta-lactamase class C family)
MNTHLWTRRTVLTAALATTSLASPLTRGARGLSFYGSPPFIAWHGKTLAEHTALRDRYAMQGYRFLSLSIYARVTAPIYAAVMIKRPAVVAQRDWPCMTAGQWQQTFNEQAAQGFGPVILAATGSASDPRFAAVFQPQDPIPLTRHGLTSGDAADLGTIQGMNNKAKSQGLILHWSASYGSAADPRFAAIWMPNTGAVLWNNDGQMEDAGTYQARFDAETSVWCRPGFVTLDGDNRYMSLFVADEIGPWVARHNMTPDAYQTEFNTWTAKGYFPICVQAAGGSAAAARFAALFVQTEDVVAKRFSATGPIANSRIDDAVQEVMRTYPVARHASLAIVNGKKLVYARGYTLAEPSWPVVQPTTHFRVASVSKTVTALAVFQLIERKKLGLTDTLQSILQLKTPSGGAPPDSRFSKITIQHLLEHRSGLNAEGFNDGVAVVKAFKDAGRSASLPVTQAMTDSYIASRWLTNKDDKPPPLPGTTQTYSNCGYYLLGRVVAHLYGEAVPIDAYRRYLLDPLGIKRIRSAVDLVSDQGEDEARYQDRELRVDQSLMTPDQPLVAFGYGNEEVALLGGAGGLSAAATDLARLIAILISQNDNPALKRATITGMLSAAARLKAAGYERAGYGLDDAKNYGGGRFYGLKGGELSDSASVLQFDDQWGFMLCFGSPAQVDGATPSWYPDFPAVMSEAKTALGGRGTTDLFPQFGMSSL